MANVDIVNKMYQGLATGDIPGALNTMDPEIEWIEAEGFPYAGTYRGPQAVLDGVFARLGGEWEGFAAVPELIVSDGGQVVARGWYSGTYKATGRSFKARFVHWFEVAGDRIVRFEQLTDTVKVREAL